jgi:hypothetical protein
VSEVKSGEEKMSLAEAIAMLGAIEENLLPYHEWGACAGEDPGQHLRALRALLESRRAAGMKNQRFFSRRRRATSRLSE